MFRQLSIIGTLWIGTVVSSVALTNKSSSSDASFQGNLLMLSAERFGDAQWRDVFYTHGFLDTALNLLNLQERADESLDAPVVLNFQVTHNAEELIFRVLIDELDRGMAAIQVPFINEFLGLLKMLLENRDDLEVLMLDENIQERLQNLADHVLGEPASQFPALTRPNRRFLMNIRLLVEGSRDKVLEALNEAYINAHAFLPHVLDYLYQLFTYMYHVRSCQIVRDYQMVDRSFVLMQLMNVLPVQNVEVPANASEAMRLAFYTMLYRHFDREQNVVVFAQFSDQEDIQTQAIRRYLKFCLQQLMQDVEPTQNEELGSTVNREDIIIVVIEDPHGRLYIETPTGRHYLPCNCTEGPLR